MVDKVSKQKRSEIMSAIKSKDSAMEIGLRKELSRLGLRYRKNVKNLEGKPDIAFIGKKVVIFLDSCFWHGCRWHCRIPQANRSYWQKKIERNKIRDKKINKIYKEKDWKVLRFWEHEIKNNPSCVLNRIKKILCDK